MRINRGRSEHPLIRRGAKLVLVIGVVLLFDAVGTNGPVGVTAAADPGDSSGVEVPRDDSDGRVQIQITAADGRLAWSDVYCAVARALNLDETAFATHRPHGEIDLRRRSTRAAVAVASLTVPGVDMQHIRGSRTEEPHLLVTIDRDLFLSGWREGKAFLRQTVTGSDSGTSTRFGLAVDDSWDTAPAGITRVVLLHGYNASALSIESLAEELRSRGYPCALGTYPNDQSIDQCANWLLDELVELFDSREGKHIALITNSMGGLVARRMLEDSMLDPGRIDRLIMIVPPSHGSNLARVAFGSDVWEHFLRSSGFDLDARFYRSIDDGLGEAAHDLRPGSPFLRELNARDRNPRVAYTIILGDRGRFTDGQRERLRSSLDALSKRSKTVKLVSPRIDDVLADLDEVVEGRGDGVVSLSRGRLDGVGDVHILKCRHDVITRLNGKPGRQLLEIVIERLTLEEPAAPSSSFD